MRRRAFILKASQQSVGLAFLPSILSAGFFDSESSGILAEVEEDKVSLYMPDIIKAPDNQDEWPEFRNLLNTWRKEEKAKIDYDDKLYRNPDFKWVSSAYNCYFLMMYDELFYNW